MENMAEEKFDPINCSTTDKSEEELKDDGWTEVFSFHSQIPEQWQMACEKVNSYRNLEGYEIVLANPSNESQRSDGIQLIFIKRPEK